MHPRPESVRVLAVDWSGARHGGERRIAVAEAWDGQVRRLVPGLDREGAVEHAVAAAQRGPVVAGFDFAFSFPEWFAREQLGCGSIGEVWARVASDGERWLRDCQPPFWGRAGRPRPVSAGEPRQFRRTDAESALHSQRPKSVFQVGGSGSVGTGSVRGMPFLPVLRDAGFTIWPFDRARSPLAVEIYPRLLTGPVVKSDRDARVAALRADERVPDALVEEAAASDDAFDATLSAAVMASYAHALLALDARPDYGLEGAIWAPERRPA